MEKSIFDFVELHDYIEEESERTEVFPTDDPSRACAIYCALHSAILFCCRENFMVINLDDVETLKFETGEYKGKTFKFICIRSKYKDTNGNQRVSDWQHHDITKPKPHKESYSTKTPIKNDEE